MRSWDEPRSLQRLEAFPIYRAYGESELRRGVVLTLSTFTLRVKPLPSDQFRLIDRNG